MSRKLSYSAMVLSNHTKKLHRLGVYILYVPMQNVQAIKRLVPGLEEVQEVRLSSSVADTEYTEAVYILGPDGEEDFTEGATYLRVLRGTRGSTDRLVEALEWVLAHPRKIILDRLVIPKSVTVSELLARFFDADRPILS